MTEKSYDRNNMMLNNKTSDNRYNEGYKKGYNEGYNVGYDAGYNIKINKTNNNRYNIINIAVNGSSFGAYNNFFSRINNKNIREFILNHPPTDPFEYGFVYNYLKPHDKKLKIGMVLLHVGGNSFDGYPSNPAVTPNIFHDIRMRNLRVANFIDFIEKNNMFGVILTDIMYRYNHNDDQSEWINSSPHFQKPFIIYHILKYYTIKHYSVKLDWIFYMDFDGLFNHCNHLNQIENKIFNVYTKNKNKSVIFAGDDVIVNSGVFAVKNDKIGLDLLEKWIYIIDNAHYLDLHNVEPKFVRDQKIFSSLLTAFDPYTQNHDEFNKLAKIGQSKRWKNELKPKDCYVRIPERILNYRPELLSNRNEDINKNHDTIFWHFAGGAKNPDKVNSKNSIMPSIVLHTIRQCQENFISTN